jgi:hypothetical protein
MVTAAQIMAAAQMLMVANAAGGGTGAGIFHSGGVVGAGGRVRSVWPGVFAAATRYHSGGIAGLAPREVPAILERGEEVLTRGDPRHILNGGGGGVGGQSDVAVHLKNVNVFDANEVLESALNTRVGEKVMMNFVRRNGRALRSAMGGD